MKNIVLIAISFCLAQCQINPRTASVKNFAKIPAFDLLLMDSITVFNTSLIPPGNPVILMYFSPDCDHCQRQTIALLKNINDLRNVRIYLFTPMPFGDIRSFYTDYHLTQYTNVMVGRDFRYAFYKYYNAKSFPCTVFYNDKKQLIKLYREEIDIHQILKTLHS